jgi:hypothetical protein
MQVRASALSRRVAAAVCAAALTAASSGCGDKKHHAACEKGFDRAAWSVPGSKGRDSLVGHPSKRQQLADRVVACQTLDGRKRSDVRALLGKPDFPSRSTKYYYELGAGRSAGLLDNEFLSINFNQHARVTTVEIIGF